MGYVWSVWNISIRHYMHLFIVPHLLDIALGKNIQRFRVSWLSWRKKFEINEPKTIWQNLCRTLMIIWSQHTQSDSSCFRCCRSHDSIPNCSNNHTSDGLWLFEKSRLSHSCTYVFLDIVTLVNFTVTDQLTFCQTFHVRLRPCSYLSVISS